MSGRVASRNFYGHVKPSRRKLRVVGRVVCSVILYALATRQIQETVDRFLTRDEAEVAVREVVHDDPRLDG